MFLIPSNPEMTCADRDGEVIPRAGRHARTQEPKGSVGATRLSALFPGKMGRVMLTRVAIRIRRPELLKLKAESELEPALLATLNQAIVDIRRG